MTTFSNGTISCTNLPFYWTFFIFAAYVATMILSLFGNATALVVFLFRPSRFRKQQVLPLTRNFSVYSHSHPTSPQQPRFALQSVHLQPQQSFTKSLELSNSSPLVAHKPKTPIPTLRSPSSFTYYLASLALSDLLMALFCIPFTFTQMCLGQWPFPTSLCPLVVYAQQVMVTASSLTNTTISLNRLFGIVNPLQNRNREIKNPFRHTGILLTSIWVVALTSSSVQLIVTRVLTDNSHLPQCSESWGEDLRNRSIYSVVLFFFIYVIPLAIQGCTYGYIGYHLWKRSIPGVQVQTAVEDVRLREKRRIIKMLVSIVMMFGICWLPSHLYCLLTDFTTVLQYLSSNTIRITFGVCHWIAMSNSFVNPIIYLYMSQSFRNELCCMVRCLCPCRWKNAPDQR